MSLRNLQCLLVDGTDLWCGTDTGLWHLPAGELAAAEQVRKDCSVLCLMRDLGAGGLLCGTSKGLLVFDGETWQREPALGNREVRCLAWGSGTLWCGTNQGLWRRSNDRWQPIETEALPVNVPFNCLLTTTEGLLCGTESGLLLFDGEEVTVVLNAVNVLCLLRTGQGSLWCGTATGLLQRPTGSDWLCDLKVGRSRVSCLLEVQQERDRTVWCATAEGLWRFNSPDRELVASEVGAVQSLAHDGTRLHVGGVAGLAAISGPTVQEQKLRDVPPETTDTRQRFLTEITGADTGLARTPEHTEEQTARDGQQTTSVPKQGSSLWLGSLAALLLVMFGIRSVGPSVFQSNTPQRAEPVTIGSPIEVAERFYRILSEEGRLPTDLTTRKLRSNLGDRSELVLRQGNLVAIAPVTAETEWTRRWQEIELRLSLRNQAVLDASLTMVPDGKGWAVHRVRYFKEKAWQCLNYKSVRFTAFDSSIYTNGVTKRKLPSPCRK
jgi:hypothetical protein